MWKGQVRPPLKTHSIFHSHVLPKFNQNEISYRKGSNAEKFINEVMNDSENFMKYMQSAYFQFSTDLGAPLQSTVSSSQFCQLVDLSLLWRTSQREFMFTIIQILIIWVSVI